MIRNKKLRELILEIVEQIKSGYEPERIILYGSYAYGKPTEDSDIDLLIIKETDKRRADRFVEVTRLIYKPGRRTSVSPLVYTPQELAERSSLGDDFIEEVLKRGEVLYAR